LGVCRRSIEEKRTNLNKKKPRERELISPKLISVGGEERRAPTPVKRKEREKTVR